MDDLDYRAISPVIMKEMSSRQRFVRFEERLDTSDMSSDMMLKIAHGKYLNAWKGVPFLKDCLSLAIVQKLFWEEKPQTVIELGAWKGGSALWSAHMLKILGVKSHVFSMDIDLSLLDPVAKECPDVTFIEGNSNEIEKCFPPELLQTLPHPWFITEDVHINIVEVLKYFDKFTEPGDYICVEDTNPLAPNQPGQGLIKELGYTPFGHSKLDKLKEFMKTHSERYLVDQLYTDLFGYNVTWNSNGFLKRV